MKKIVISYWHLTKYDDLIYDHNAVYVYTKHLRISIIDNILERGYAAMLKKNEETKTLTILIDKHRFGQR